MTELIGEYPTKVAPKIADALSRYERVVLACFEVRNQKQHGENAAEIAELTRLYAEQHVATHPGAELWLASTPQDDGGGVGDGVTGAANAIVRANWAAWGAARFVDFEAESDLLPGGYAANPGHFLVDDEVHPNSAGQAVMAAAAAAGQT